MYDYREAMRNDIKDAIEGYDLSSYEDLDEAYETIYEDLWIDDSVTGNGSGSYTFNRAQAREYVLDNMALVGEACKEFGVDAAILGQKFMEEDYEYLDVTLRCFLLGEILSEIIY